MKFILKMLPLIVLILLVEKALANEAIEEAVNGLLDENIETVCAKYPMIPKETCNGLVTAGVRSVAGLDVDADALKAAVKNPEFLNSILVKSFGDGIPLSLEFKMLDSDAGESVLGLSYFLNYDLGGQGRDDSGKWSKRTLLFFKASGTVTNDSKTNPRNFLDTKLSFSKAFTTKIPSQSDEFGSQLTDGALAAAMACAGAGKSTEACTIAKEKNFQLLDSTSSFLRAFQRYEVGIDAGYESDQDFEATQAKVGIYMKGQYENWGTNTLIRGVNITPSFCLSIDKVDPNEETPRALAGDNSSFYRSSAEFSLWIPIGTHFDQRLSLTFNYRYYREIDPEDVIEAAGLDTYNLKTYSLTTPTGLFMSYSSGELPLDQKTDDVLALGWQTYF